MKTVKIKYLNFLSHRRTINNNNVTALQRDIFSGMSRIRALRLSDNPFACDCHLSWLSRFLRSSPRLAPYTRCHSPSQLKGQNVADLHDQEFKCSGEYNFMVDCCFIFNNIMWFTVAEQIFILSKL